jgi:hypothetical protein
MKQQRNKSSSWTFYPWSFGRQLLTLLTAMLFTIMPQAAELHAAPMESFLLFYSNNIMGETEPCG